MAMITNETRNLIENNLGVVYGFMKKRGIYDLDLFQELALYLCEQTDKYYNKDRGSFSTFAYYIMGNYLGRIYAKQNKREAIEGVSLDELSESENVSFYESVVKYEDCSFENIVQNEYLLELIKDLKPQRRLIVKLWIEGYTDTEIAEKLQISKQAVNKFKHKLRKKVKERR